MIRREYRYHDPDCPPGYDEWTERRGRTVATISGGGGVVIVLSGGAREAIVEHAREGVPEEVCGVLAGRYDPDESRADRAYRTPNVASRPEITYEIDPETLFETIDEIEAAGSEVVGFYHSHPTGPRGPSPTDEARATWVEYSYVIVEPGADPFLGSWRWTGDTFESETLRIGDSSVDA